MKIIILLFSAFFAAVLQKASPEIGAVGIKLPLLQGVVVYYALTRRADMTLAAGLVAGLLHDALSLMPLGYSVLCFCAVGIVANRFRDVVFNESFLTIAFFGAVFAAVGTAALGAALRYGGVMEVGWGRIFLKAGGEAIAGLVCAPLIFRVLAGMDRLTGNAPRRREPIDAEIRYSGI